MPLKSNLFAGDTRLEACAVSNPDHITLGASGPYVRKIQTAVMILDGVDIDQSELETAYYGANTARAVLAYKEKRDIVNRSYQSQADDIVGIMTIQTLDNELLAAQQVIPPKSNPVCHRICTCWRADAKSASAKRRFQPTRPVRPPDIVVALQASRLWPIGN
jgi:hypothetical protein